MMTSANVRGGESPGVTDPRRPASFDASVAGLAPRPWTTRKQHSNALETAGGGTGRKTHTRLQPHTGPQEKPTKSSAAVWGDLVVADVRSNTGHAPGTHGASLQTRSDQEAMKRVGTARVCFGASVRQFSPNTRTKPVTTLPTLARVLWICSLRQPSTGWKNINPSCW
jgi:hypothetical protein